MTTPREPAAPISETLRDDEIESALKLFRPDTVAYIACAELKALRAAPRSPAVAKADAALVECCLQDTHWGVKEFNELLAACRAARAAAPPSEPGGEGKLETADEPEPVRLYRHLLRGYADSEYERDTLVQEFKAALTNHVLRKHAAAVAALADEHEFPSPPEIDAEDRANLASMKALAARRPSEAGEALKPCPFCGGEAEFKRKGTSKQSCVVWCVECGATHESSDTFDSGASWNRRANSEGT